MPRTYSKNGCIRCKQRKKKCTEERPACAACAKWNWTCEYDPCSSQLHSLGTATPRVNPQASLSTRTLSSSAPGDSEIESIVLQCVPERIKMYYSPTSANGLADLQTMFQLMMTNELLRHAIVACFTVAGNTEALAKLNRIAYGRALQSLRSKVLLDSLDQENRICVITAIAFLGKMESFGPNSLADQLEHWVALIPLLESKEMLGMMQRGVIPLNETMLIFESLLYHVATDAMFSRNLDRVWHLWRSHRTYERICILNPEGPSRIKLSPLLAGQYELYDLALEITYLSQCRHEKYIPWNVADKLEAKVRRRIDQLDVDFTTNAHSAMESAKYHAEHVLYQAFCNALLIFITALREPSFMQRSQMKQLVDRGIRLTLWRPSDAEMPIVMRHVNHLVLAAVWPNQIVACAAYDLKQLGIFVHHFAGMERILDPGHLSRTKALFAAVSEILHGSRSTNQLDSDTDAPPLPPGLVLLRQGVGALNVDRA